MTLLSYIYIFLISSNTLAGAIVATFSAANWSTMTRAQIVLACVGIFQTWSTAMIALTITLARREAQGKPLVPINGNGNTEQFTKPPEPTNEPK